MALKASSLIELLTALGPEAALRFGVTGPQSGLRPGTSAAPTRKSCI